MHNAILTIFTFLLPHLVSHMVIVVEVKLERQECGA